MRRSLYWKLTLAFMLIAFTTAALVAVFIRVTSADRLLSLIIEQQRSNMEQLLVEYYTATGSWNNIGRDWYHLQRLIWAPSMAQNEEEFIPVDPGLWNEMERRNLFGLADEQGVVIVPLNPDYPAGSRVSERDLRDGTPVVVDSETVGTLLTVQQAPGFNPAEKRFLDRTNQALIYAMLGALGIALIVGIFLARTLTRPLQALNVAAQNIAAGKLDQQVKITSNDEIGQLGASFNRMSQEVARVNQQRRQMTADIAHDLRTPLTVIAGYIESMHDGVLQPTTQRLALIYSEIERLQQLVGDLRMLSQADAGELHLNPQPIAPHLLLERAAELFTHHAEQHGLTLKVEAAPDLPEIRVDEARLMQVLDNLISNALRYTPAGGVITLAAQAQDWRVQISVRDTGSGIPAEELPFIFDRFHRADKSRHSESGESGLGLAIVKALVEAHGGRVSAESAVDQGTAIHLVFPTNPA